VRSVTTGELRPRRREILTTSKPLAIKADACVCLNAWNMTSGRLSDLHTRRQSRERLSGDMGEPSGRPKTSAVGSGFRIPNVPVPVPPEHRVRRAGPLLG
jgi:hypothetical protein